MPLLFLKKREASSFRKYHFSPVQSFFSQPNNHYVRNPTTALSKTNSPSPPHTHNFQRTLHPIPPFSPSNKKPRVLVCPLIQKLFRFEICQHLFAFQDGKSECRHYLVIIRHCFSKIKHPLDRLRK